jgi:hypothetical protein
MSLPPEVGLLRKPTVEPLDAGCKRRIERPYDRVVVRRHETELGNLPSVAKRSVRQSLHERKALLLVDEEWLLGDSPPDDVVDGAGGQDSVAPRHTETLRLDLSQKCNEIVPRV